MMKDVTILTFDEMEMLRTQLDYIYERLEKASNNDLDGVRLDLECYDLANDVKQLIKKLN